MARHMLAAVSRAWIARRRSVRALLVFPARKVTTLKASAVVIWSDDQRGHRGDPADEAHRTVRSQDLAVDDGGDRGRSARSPPR